MRIVNQVSPGDSVGFLLWTDSGGSDYMVCSLTPQTSVSFCTCLLVADWNRLGEDRIQDPDGIPEGEGTPLHGRGIWRRRGCWQATHSKQERTLGHALRWETAPRIVFLLIDWLVKEWAFKNRRASVGWLVLGGVPSKSTCFCWLYGSWRCAWRVWVINVILVSLILKCVYSGQFFEISNESGGCGNTRNDCAGVFCCDSGCYFRIVACA